MAGLDKMLRGICPQRSGGRSFEILDSLQRLGSQQRRRLGNPDLTKPVDLRHTAVQRCDQFVQLSDGRRSIELFAQSSISHRVHRWLYVCRRAGFQISPQCEQRQ